MSFGRRTAPPTRHAPAPTKRSVDAPRRGGYWLGLAVVAVSSVAMSVLMALSPTMNPRGGPLGPMMAPILGAAANVTVLAALVFLLVDLTMRALRWTRCWAYAVVCGTAILLVCAGLQTLLGNPIHWLFLCGLVLVPGLSGGWVMGLFRR